jgi:mono/diheme cytochrome c family protein/type 1 glutamine amidotransferase
MRLGLHRCLFVLACLGVFLPAFGACAERTPGKIVLIGGAKSEGPARHDYPNGVGLLKAFLQSSPDAPTGLQVEAYPDGWPPNPAAFDGAATIVWYFDGADRHPLLDATHRQQFEKLMARGVGLVALHQASTVPADDKAIDLARWLGGARYGMFDRTTEFAELQLASAAHPIGHGAHAFAYRDEFYPTFRFRNDGRGIVPILQSTLHVQYRDGAAVVEDRPEVTTVAWAFERASGGRSFAFSGAHFLAALDEPTLRTVLLNAIFWSARIDVPKDGVRSALPQAATLLARQALDAAPPAADGVAAPDVATFHHDAQRSGWYPTQAQLTPISVAQGSFGLLWESPQLDSVDGSPARLYASPLYVDRVTISAGQHRDGTFPIVFAASNNGWVYALNAFKTGDVAAGRILWHTRLGAPCRLQPAPLDGVATGILSTPVIDVARKRLYVTHCDPEKRWQAYALDIGSGEILAGWPLSLDEASFNALNRNAGPKPIAPTRRFDFRVQRGALNLSPDGAQLYIAFGETETGWLVAVDTAQAKVASAFAVVAMPHRGSGGIWGAGGAALDAQGHVFVATGTGFNGYVDQAHDWSQSVLMLSFDHDGFALKGTYTPFNYCKTAAMDIDLGSGGAALLPELDAATTATPQLLVVGGKQGNVTLLDRAHLPGRVDRRPACSADAASDASLLAQQTQPQFGTRGPLNVFAPYSEKDAALDSARARSVPAVFRNGGGKTFVFVSGNSKQAEGSPTSIPPSLARLEVVTAAGKPAYLRVDQLEQTVVFENPGSPVVTSNGARDAIVWVLDENARRSAPLVGADAPQPVLYAFDAMTLKPLWKSEPGELFTSGKYNEPAFARGTVFVGSDRIQAFGAGRTKSLPKRVTKNNPAAAATAAAPTPAMQPARSPASAKPDGKSLYAQRCAICHDHAQGNIPPRELIAARSREFIVDALVRGAMRAQAQGLRRDEIEAIAGYLK